MPSQTKPITLLMAEGNKRHLTKAEISLRTKAESELMTGISLKENPEVRDNPVAHKEFTRLRRLFKAIHKDDDISGNSINTHCLLYAESKEYEKIKSQIESEMNSLRDKYQIKEVDFAVYVEQMDRLRSALFACDKKIMDKRKMMLDIAKENIMTIQSALRSIPKKVEKKEESPMSKFMARRLTGE